MDDSFQIWDYRIKKRHKFLASSPTLTDNQGVEVQLGNDPSRHDMCTWDLLICEGLLKS